MLLKQGCNEILRPDMLTALYNTLMWSQVMFDNDVKKRLRGLEGVHFYPSLDFFPRLPAQTGFV